MNKTPKTTYQIKITYEDKVNKKPHTLTETWQCDISDLDLILSEALDLVKDDNGAPVKPEFNKMKDSLSRYMTEKEVKSVFNRQKKMFNIYSKIRKAVNVDDTECIIELDKSSVFELKKI